MSTPSTGTVRLAVIPGDGIGPEVTAEALKVLEAASPDGVKFEPTRYDLGADAVAADDRDPVGSRHGRRG